MQQRVTSLLKEIKLQKKMQTYLRNINVMNAVMNAKFNLYYLTIHLLNKPVFKLLQFFVR